MPYFYGEDVYAAREAISKLAGESKAEIKWLDKRDFAELPAGQVLSQQGGLFGQTVLVVRDPSSFSKATQEDIVSVLKEGTAAVLWDRAKPDKRSKFWKAVKDQAQEFPNLNEGALVEWLLNLAAEHKGAIEETAASELIKRVGLDRWRLKSELERLLLLNPSDPAMAGMGLDLVKEHVDAKAEVDIFPTLDALVSGDKSTAIKNIETLLIDGNSEFYILSMLAYQFKTLLMIKSGLDDGLSQQEISRQGNFHPFVVQKNSAVANRFSVDELRDTLTKIMATDVAIKQGKVDARTGLMMLVIGLVK